MIGGLIFIYLALGALFGVAFILRGCRRIDPAAADAKLVTRLMWLPATLVFWPLLLKKWIEAPRARTDGA